MTIVSLMLDKNEPDAIQHAPYAVVPTIATLTAGTAWVLCNDNQLIAVWRLDTMTFFHMLKNNELFTRAAMLKAISPWAYIVLCGVFTPDKNGYLCDEEIETGWGWAAYEGALLTLQEIGVFAVVIGKTPDHYVGALSRIDKRDRGVKRCEPLRETLFSAPAELLLTAIPGIGYERAEELLRYCGSAAWALSALVNGDTDGMPGFGPKLCASARQALGLRDNQIFSIEMRDELYERRNTTASDRTEPAIPATIPSAAVLRAAA